MSELKIYKQSDILRGHWFTEYCRKDEADKVIAEQDKEIAELKEQVHEYALGFCQNQLLPDVRAKIDGGKIMAIELHHLNTHGMMEQAGNVLDGVSKLKTRIAELEKENESLKYSVAALETDLAMSQRWRKFSEEKPNEDTWCIVFHDGEIDSDHYMRFTYNQKCDFALYGNKVTHWMPLPSDPKEVK